MLEPQYSYRGFEISIVARAIVNPRRPSLTHDPVKFHCIIQVHSVDAVLRVDSYTSEREQGCWNEHESSAVFKACLFAEQVVDQHCAMSDSHLRQYPAQVGC